jgi:hypothetical protein
LRASIETQQSNADLASFLSAGRPAPVEGVGDGAAPAAQAAEAPTPNPTPGDLGETGTGE